jgi:hypothetical protein
MARLKDSIRDDYMLVEIHPCIIGQPYGLGDEDIFFVLMASRLKGYSLFPINRWPCPVYVIRILDDRILGSSSFDREQVEMMSWGVIHQI